MDAFDDALGQNPDETLQLLVQMSHATDEHLRACVRRLLLDQTRRGIPRNRGVAEQRTVPAHRGGDVDIDRSMDATIGARAEARMPSVEELRAVATAAARSIDELIILAPADDDEARRLARDSATRMAPISPVLDVPAAVSTMMADDRV